MGCDTSQLQTEGQTQYSGNAVLYTTRNARLVHDSNWGYDWAT